MVTIFITILHILVSLFLILVVLAQTGKGQDLASAFGGTGSQTAFGARGTATLLSKITAGAAVMFMVTSLSLSYLRPAVGAGDSLIQDEPAPAAPAEIEEPAPAAEEAPAPAEAAEPEAEAPPEEPPAEGEGESEGEGEPPPQ